MSSSCRCASTHHHKPTALASLAGVWRRELRCMLADWTAARHNQAATLPAGARLQALRLRHMLARSPLSWRGQSPQSSASREASRDAQSVNCAQKPLWGHLRMLPAACSSLLCPQPMAIALRLLRHQHAGAVLRSRMSSCTALNRNEMQAHVHYLCVYAGAHHHRDVYQRTLLSDMVVLAIIWEGLPSVANVLNLPRLWLPQLVF